MSKTITGNRTINYFILCYLKSRLTIKNYIDIPVNILTEYTFSLNDWELNHNFISTYMFMYITMYVRYKTQMYSKYIFELWFQEKEKKNNITFPNCNIHQPFIQHIWVRFVMLYFFLFIHGIYIRCYDWFGYDFWCGTLNSTSTYLIFYTIFPPQFSFQLFVSNVIHCF